MNVQVLSGVPQYFLDGRSIFWTAAVFFGRPQYFLDGRSIFWTAAVFFGAGRRSVWLLPSPSCDAPARLPTGSAQRVPWAARAASRCRAHSLSARGARLS